MNCPVRLNLSDEINMEESSDNDKEKNNDLSEINKIFKVIYSKAPTVLKDLSDKSIDIDYKDSISNHIDFKTINQKIEDGEYTLITDVIKDIRLVFLNCYTFYGAKSDLTIKSLKLEELFENKISCLDENFKSLASIQHTFSLLKMDGKQSFKFRYPKNCYDSILLRSVAHLRPERLKKYHNIFSNTHTTDENSFHTLEELVGWENEVYFNDNYKLISSMWELPEIGNFVAVIFKQFDFDIVNQGEIERMFLMPKESTTMSKIMTTLLMPIKRTKYIGQEMPYKIWSEKLSKKVSKWYKVYQKKNKNKVSTIKSLGIHPDFWAVVGDKNPLAEHDYCELSYFTKVWIVKGLCDYVTNEYKTINDIIANCNERQCTIWKNNMETEEYFYFDSMPDLRIYYYNIPYNEPSLTFLEPDDMDEKIMEEDNTSSNSDISNIFHPKSRIKPNEKYFKLIANSVQGLRSFLDELDNEDTSVPENLIQALEDFLTKVEPQEYNLIVLENNSKIKLFEDWKSYPDRCLREKDKVLLWEEKELKPISYDTGGEIILEKRKRKAVVIQGFDFDVEFESDERISEEDVEILSDFTDPEDEWGAMNQPKKKSRQVVQRTPSKLCEIEKRLKEEDKLIKRSKKYSISCDMKDNFYDVENKNVAIGNEQKDNKTIIKDKVENKSVIVENKENNSKQNVLSISNTFYNDCNNSSVNSLNMDNVYMKIKELSSCENDVKKEDIISIDSEKNNTFILIKNDKTLLRCEMQNVEGENNKCENILHSQKIKTDVLENENIVTIDDDELDMQPHSTKLKTHALENENIVTIDDDEFDDCGNLRKDNSKSIISNNAVIEQGDGTKSESNFKNDNEIISIDDDDDDDDQIVISDDEDDVQIISVTRKPQESPVKINKPCSLNRNCNNPYNSWSRNKKMMTSNSSNRQIPCTSVPKLSPYISIMPANVHVPKGIEVTMAKRPHSTITSHFKSTKRPTTNSNGCLTNNGSVNVECKVISKPNLNGEVKFYVSLPNGKLHPVSDELMNQYLKEHNNILPDYWIVPLSVEVAKQYGFN